MTDNTEDLDLMAMQRLGKPYSECNTNEQSAVRASVDTHRIIDEMKASGAMTIGELFEARRKNREEDRK
jgi:hypothetical protein